MRSPSLPTVISFFALFVALGGTSYAVIRLPANSVSNRHLRDNAVTGKEIRNRSIGPSDLSAAASRRGPRGPQGPAGPAGQSLQSGGIAAPTPWQPLVFAGVWTNYGAPYAGASYRVDQLGKVHLRGLVTKNGALPALADVIATLPEGRRPVARMTFAVASGTLGRVDVLANGNILWMDGGTTEKDFSSFDTISFWTD